MEKDNMIETLDYLPNTEIHLYQRKDMFRFNTDTHLLGCFMKLNDTDSVLDIGTNNGALLLYASLQTSGTLYGVEIQEEACKLAEKNFQLNKITNYRIYNKDIKDLSLSEVDVIICNPPYFKVEEGQELTKNQSLQLARHEVALDLVSLVSSVKRLLKEQGKFFLVHRANRSVEIMTLLQKNEIEVKRIQYVYDEYHEQAHGILIEAVKGGKSHCVVEKPYYVTR